MKNVIALFFLATSLATGAAPEKATPNQQA